MLELFSAFFVLKFETLRIAFQKRENSEKGLYHSLRKTLIVEKFSIQLKHDLNALLLIVAAQCFQNRP